MKLSIVISLLFLLSSCVNEKNDQVFKVYGQLKDIKDESTVLLMMHNEVMDSSLVQDGNFEFQGVIEQPTSAILLIKGTANYKSLWLEPREIRISGNSDQLKLATITGSKLNAQSSILKNRLKKEKDIYYATSDKIVELESLSLYTSRREEIKRLKKKMELKKFKIDSITAAFIAEFPNSPISLNNLNVYKFSFGKEMTAALYDLMNENSKATEKGKLIQEFIAKSLKPEVGDPYVDFAQPDAAGEIVKISDVSGDTYTLIEFWASWCAPCIKANPDLIALYNSYNKSGFEIIGISHDASKEAWINAINRQQLPWTNLSELKGEENNGAAIYEVNIIPDNVLINSEGIIVARCIKSDSLQAILETNLGAK
ncbi:AhpC/TSA family protein [Dokdonia sinensis]|uniref:AhpC/TSA family protein n=1 Tax=Dokdonia sinensis TaxID=2479847 RepID=A0A3M0G4I8_9FLAO|nr:TlpA disulfide reductase family protein [Dokdonia sinensis]RMB57132.1 AhpC/TSA family protein [Dokdonia sinensis]